MLGANRYPMQKTGPCIDPGVRPRRTFSDSRSNEVVEPKILSRTNVWTSAPRALVEAYVQTNQPALAKVHESLILPGFRYPMDFSYGPETECRISAV